MIKPHYSYIFSIIIAATVAIFEVNTIPELLTTDFNENAIMINDGAIKRIDYLTAVTMMAEEKTLPMQKVDYQLIVDRLTEEELLFQHGLEQDIIFQPQISQVVVSNLLETIAIQHTSKEYSDKELYNIYQQKIAGNIEDSAQNDDLAFNKIKEDLGNALREVERNKALRNYLLWLRNRSDISESEQLTIGELQ